MTLDPAAGYHPLPADLDAAVIRVRLAVRAAGARDLYAALDADGVVTLLCSTRGRSDDVVAASVEAARRSAVAEGLGPVRIRHTGELPVEQAVALMRQQRLRAGAQVSPRASWILAALVIAAGAVSLWSRVAGWSLGAVVVAAAVVVAVRSGGGPLGLDRPAQGRPVPWGAFVFVAVLLGAAAWSVLR